MKRLISLLVLLGLFASLGLDTSQPASAQAPIVTPTPSPTSLPPTPTVEARTPDGVDANPPTANDPAPRWIEPTWLLSSKAQSAGVQLFGQLASVAAQQPTRPSGDWSNGWALACISPLGVALNAALGAGLVIPWPWDFFAALAEYTANLGLKLCAPALFPPGNIQRTAVNQNGVCGYTFNQPRTSGEFKNFYGLTLPWGDIFPGKDWGDFNQPAVLHWNTDVKVSVTSPNWQRTAPGKLWLPAGTHTLTWRGDTLYTAWDFVFIYIPQGAWLKLGKMSKIAKYVKDAEKFARVAGRAANAGQKGLDLLFGSVLKSYRSGMFNTETQRVAVLDNIPPMITNHEPGTVAVEAITPGGMSRSAVLAQMRRTLSVSDNCDPTPDLSETDNLPDYIPVNGTGTVSWVATDNGPQNLNGGVNTSALLQQTFIITDTKPPIILAPPDIVTETTTIPAIIGPGYPATFDLADLNPTVIDNACTRPGVTCDPDGTIHFPAGKTTVTWTATDVAGNASTANQLVNVKTIGSNHAPTSNSLTGANAPHAISFEPITITLTAQDSDADPLWFTIKDQPQHGFFHSPLYPYFIQDYRLANFGNINFLSWCADPSHRQQYIPTHWPVNAGFMTVGDDGTVYVHDQGMIWCSSLGDVSTNYRLAVFHPDGTWSQTISSPEVRGVYMDWRNGFIYTTRTDVGGSYSLLLKYDLDLNPIASYDLDASNAPFFSTGPRQGLMDNQSIIYVTDGFQYSGAAHLFLLDGRTPNKPDLLADYSLPGAVWQDLALDSQGNLYASEKNKSRIYKFSPATIDVNGQFTPGGLIGWLGKCDSGPGCDQANHRSFGYSCTDATCTVATPSGNGPGQFNFPRGIALDPNGILYVTDYTNLRVQRFTPEGYYAGQAVSKCDGSCFVLGDFGAPRQVTVNSSHFYVLDDNADLLHVFETTPLTRVDGHTAQIQYQSENNFVGADQFTFNTTDGLAASNVATVNVNITRNYRPPTLNPVKAVTTTEDFNVPLALSAYDPDGTLDTLSFQIDQPPAHGTLTGTGLSAVYVPDRDFNGTEVFSLVASDGVLLSTPQMVTVTVTPVNDVPSFPDDGTTPPGFAYRLTGSTIDLSRFTHLGTSDNPTEVGRGFSTMFTVHFYDPDAQDTHLVNINWGDGTPIEPEGKLLPDGTTTGPILSEGTAGGIGTVTAKHIFNQSGDYTSNFCVTDNVAVDANGNKTPTANSTMACHSVVVHVATTTNMLLDVKPSSNPVPAGQPLTYTLTLSNSVPDSGVGLTATGLVVTDTLDPRAQFQFVQTPDGTCSHTTDTITCDLNSLAPGEAATIEIGVNLLAELVPGDNLSNLTEYRLDQPDQADVPTKFDLFTVVAPADFIVNTIADDSDSNTSDGLCADAHGACTLRAAIEQANATPGAQSIALPDWQVILNTDLAINDDVTITGLGAGKTILGGDGSHRILTIGSGVAVTITDVTVQGGYATSADGGGLRIAAGANATLNRVQLSGNHADQRGGAIWNDGTLIINDSSITGNDANTGAGGIGNAGTLSLSNVTVSGNIGQSGGVNSTGAAALINVTIANNHATTSGGGLSGGAANFTLQNTILADNTAEVSGPNCGGFTSQGHNLIDDVSGCTISGQATSDIIGQNARLAPLDLNDGDTMTQGVLGGSPAIDHGACVLPADQRGVTRPQDGNLDQVAACDIGAFEFVPARVFLPLVVK